MPIGLIREQITLQELWLWPFIDRAEDEIAKRNKGKG